MKYLLLVLSLLLVSGMSHAGEYRARVLNVIEHRTYYRPNYEECYNYETYEDNNYYEHDFRRGSRNGGTVIGAIIGGVIGNQIGSGRGKVATTILGGGVGAVVGQNYDRNRRRYENNRDYRYRYNRYRRRCYEYTGYGIYYEVIYELHGRSYSTVTYSYPSRDGYIFLED